MREMGGNLDKTKKYKKTKKKKKHKKTKNNKTYKKTFLRGLFFTLAKLNIAVI